MPSSSRHNAECDRALTAFLILLAWIPIPFSGRPVWAEALMCALVSMLSLYCIYHQLSLPHKSKTKAVLLVLVGTWFIQCCWLFLQTISIPVAIMETISPARLSITAGIYADGIAQPISLNSSATFHNMLVSFAYLQVFCLTLVLCNTRTRLEKLLFFIVIYGSLQSMYWAIVTLTGSDTVLWFKKTDHFGVATGTFLNRNQFANYLLMCLAAGCGLLISKQKNMSSHSMLQALKNVLAWLLDSASLLRAMMMTIVVGIVLTHSRMGNLTLVASLAGAALIWLGLSGNIIRGASLIISMLVIDIFIVGAWFGMDKVVDRITSTNMAAEIRDDAIPYMTNMAHDFWLSGIGAGNFSTVFPTYSQLKIVSFYNEAHNDYFQFLIEHGIVGFSLLMLVTLLSLGACIVTLRKKKSRLLQGAAFTSLMSMIAMAIHATADYNLQVPANASLFVVMLALAWVTHALPDKRT